MTDYQTVLTRTGIALIAFGLIDIAWMAWCIVKGQGYSSSFNIFAVIAGVLLIRGSLKTARFVAGAAALFATTLAGSLFVLPLVQPWGLYVAQAHLHPLATFGALAFGLLAFAMLTWIYRQLRSAPVVSALKTNGENTAPPRLAFVGGIGVVLLLAAIFLLTMSGETDKKAIELARLQAGPGYAYFTQSLHWENGHVRATVSAYNNKEIRSIPVEWDE